VAFFSFVPEMPAAVSSATRRTTTGHDEHRGVLRQHAVALLPM
jgi:hypothetical protein